MSSPGNLAKMPIAVDDYGFQPFQNKNPQSAPETQPTTDDYGFQPLQKTQQQKDSNLIEEDLDPEIERHIARWTSRGIEQVVGLPGNLRNLAYVAKDYYQKNKPDALKKLPEPEAFKKIEEAIPVMKTVSDLIGYLPTSEQAKKFSEEKSQGYTKPQGELERMGDEVFEKIVSSSLPGTGQRNIWKNFAAPVISTLGKEGMKYIGGGEKSQLLTELGLSLVIPLAAGNAPQLNTNLWQDIERNTPNVAVNATQQRLRGQNLITRLQNEGLGSAGENRVIATVNNFLNNTQNGQMTARQLVGFNRSLNEIRGDPALLQGSRTLLNEVSGLIRDTGRQFEHVAPEFYRNWQRANEIHGAIQQSNYVARTVEKMSDKIVSDGARTLFAGALSSGAAAASAVPPIYAIYKMTQVMDRMSRSPELMRYYTGVLTNSIRGNTSLAAKDLEKLDAALLEQEKKEKKPPFKNSSQMKSPSSKTAPKKTPPK